MEQIKRLIDFSRRLPTGAHDPRAPEKLAREWEELKAELSTDRLAALTELADVVYYAAKTVYTAAALCGVTVEAAFAAALAKYEQRARPGNPKDFKVERIAVIEAVERSMLSHPTFWVGWEKYKCGEPISACVTQAEVSGWLCAARGHAHSDAVDAYAEAHGIALEADAFAEVQSRKIMSGSEGDAKRDRKDGS